MNHTATFKTYAIGFASSIVLTVLSFAAAAEHVSTDHAWPPHPFILYLLLGLAAVQFIVQSLFFLHLGMGEKKRYDTMLFALTISIVLVIVVGSIWIMSNLNYNMSPQQMDHQAIDEG